MEGVYQVIGTIMGIAMMLVLKQYLTAQQLNKVKKGLISQFNVKQDEGIQHMKTIKGDIEK